MPSQGDTIDHYEVISLLGEGGMGQVYLAKDNNLGRNVALKFLPREMEGDPEKRLRFIREARSAAALDHPFICKIYETGESEGKTYIAMEFVEGQTLEDKMKEEPFSLKESLRIALEIAEALEKAHKNGIVHRDLKPANIMLTPQGHVKVMDFGLAKRVFSGGEQEISRTMTQSSITEQGVIAGTIAYMSPEQARGGNIDARSDMFSFGIILHEMIAESHPFSKPSAIETLSSILRDPAPQTQIKPKSVNPILSPIFKKVLAKEPEDRYQNMREFIDALRKAQRELTGEARPLRRVIPIIAASIVIVVLLVVAIIRFVLPGKDSTSETELQPVSVLITDFQNKTGDSVFDGAIEQLMGISLEGAPFISLYERGQARKLADQLDPTAEGQLTADMAKLISNREGISVVVDAAIEPEGEGYIIKVWAIDPVNNKQIADANRKIKNKSEIGKAVDYLSGKLREELGGTSTESAQAFAQETFTASSLVAMNAFAQGQELMYLGKREEAIKWFLKALDNDPNLGRAYVSLAAIYTHRQQHEEAEKYFQMAMARIDQMSEREKHRTRGTYYIVKRNIPKAIEEYTALVEKFPFDSVGYLNLALSYFYARDMAKAAEMGRKAVDLDPKKAIPRYNLVWYLIGAGDFDAAEQEVYALLNLEPNYIEAYVCRALLELARGQSAQATETYRELESKSALGAALASAGLADIAAYEGHQSDALAILKEGIAFDLENAPAYIAADKYIFLAQIHIHQGQTKLALDAADRAVATSKLEEFLFSAAEIFIQAGQEDKARDLAWELSKKIQPIHRAYAKLIGGELSMARGDIPGAIQLFQEAQSLVNTWLGHYLLGRAYLESEAYAESYSEFEECLRRQGEATSVFFNDLPSFRYMPPVYYYLGRAQEGLKSPAAKDSYETFLLIKEKGEEDWMVEDARRRVNMR